MNVDSTVRRVASIAEPADEVDRAGLAAFREMTSFRPARQLIVAIGGGGRGMICESGRYVITALLLLATSASRQAAPRLKDKGPTVPRDFNGRFGFYTVVLKIDTVQEKDGLIRFTGTHAYSPGDYTMKVEGTIDRKTWRVS